MLKITERLLKESLDTVAMDPKHHLNVAIRHEIYVSFGPTAEPLEWKKRLQNIGSGIISRTYADCVRSWLSILTAREVMPVWREVIENANLLRQGFNMVDENISLLNHEGNFLTCNQEFPEYLLQLSEKTLKNLSNIETVVEELDLAHTIIGNFLGFDQEEYPMEAHHVNLAAYHALLESIGRRTYDFDAPKKLNEYIFTAYNAAPASAAFMAYAGVYEKNKWTGEFDNQASLEFWVWWLTEAIPQAWELARSTFDNNKSE